MWTAAYIKEIKEELKRISKKQEKAILEYWGNEISEEFTEQDVWEQTRKVIQNNE